MAALIKVGTDLIVPAPTSKVDDAVYAALDLEVVAVVDHTPAREDLDTLQHPADGRYNSTAEKIAARLGVITRTRPVSGFLCTRITTGKT
ncbi:MULTISPECIES: hypothetical protein [Streptomyces]|uniref:hypothetical protein n=1 Tax=Streptomyces TaxID=1883 RepID=UPI0021A39CBB|nr:hypothetical protein [Streptomyces atratus]MCT2548077.1 hypothetical protein [Streptomyces atratus]